MLFLIACFDKPEALAPNQRVRPSHHDNLTGRARQIKLGGAFRGGTSSRSAAC